MNTWAATCNIDKLRKMGGGHLRANELAHMRRALGVGGILQLQTIVIFFLFLDVKFVFESSLHTLDLVLEGNNDIKTTIES